MKILPDFLTPFRDVTSAYDQSGKMIVEKKKLRVAVRNHMADKDELKEEASRQVKARAAVHQDKINIEMPSPSDIAFFPSGSHYAALSPYDVQCFDAWWNGAAMESGIHAQIDAMTKGKKTITKAERARQLQKLDEEIHQLEVEREQMAVELEKTGLRINRSEDIDPSIFLEYEGPNRWNKVKLDNLWASISAERHRSHNINDEIAAISSEEHTHRSLFERSETVRDRERFQGNLADLREKKKELVARRTTVEEAISPMHKLHNNCVNFLKEKGVEGFGPTVVSVVSRAS